MSLTERERHIKANFIQGDIRMPRISPDTILMDPELLTPGTAAGPRMKGIHVPGLHKMNKLTIVAGTVVNVIDVRKLYSENGLNLDSTIYYEQHIDPNCPISLFAKEDRIYLNAQFIQLNGDCVGWIKNNRWCLYRANSIFYRDDDGNLEVLDSEGNIMFSGHYDEETKSLEIAGYFNGLKKVYVLSNNVIYNTPWIAYRKDAPDWLEKAKRKIASIEPTF